MEGTWLRRGSAALARSSALAALAWSLQAAPALAQGAAPVAEQPSGDPIIVTGTRIQREGGFTGTTPSTVFGDEQIADLAIVNAGDIMELIPQNTAVVSDAVAGLTAGSDVGASYANLRGLNPTLGTRPLTLVNTADGTRYQLVLVATSTSAAVPPVAATAPATATTPTSTTPATTTAG